MDNNATFTIDGHTFAVERGHPEEAGRLLANAAMQPATNRDRGNGCGFADDFCRANGPARLVRPGERRADTRYHYDVQTIGGERLHVMAYERRGIRRSWECFFSGTLEDFLLAHVHCEEIELSEA